ncbi:hypothetical protein Q8A73_012902 [Channa argus]|nr:hypothetical protein Q8A73_012902 [Channa argus]
MPKQRKQRTQAQTGSLLGPFFQNAFPSFRSLQVNGYSDGSINNNMTLAFSSGSAPNGSQIANVLIDIAPIIPDFNIDTTSITVNGTSSSGVSHKIRLATAPCLVLLSWLLTNHQ